MPHHPRHVLRAGRSALQLLTDLVGHEARQRSPHDEPVDATIIFGDIEGFSSLVAREGDDVAERVLDALDTAIDRATDDGHCRVVKRLGDGVMLACDDPGEAVRAATSLPDAFVDALDEEPFDLRLRVGAHRGVVRRRGDDLIGYHVNVAARVAEQAEAGTALITGALYDVVQMGDDLDVRPAGELIAKGVPEQPPLYRLRSRGFRHASAG